MSYNPNAVAALVAGAVVSAVEWGLNKYAHTSLSAWWKNGITVATISSVLYVGKDGLKGAFAKLAGLVKSVWSGKVPVIS